MSWRAARDTPSCNDMHLISRHKDTTRVGERRELIKSGGGERERGHESSGLGLWLLTKLSGNQIGWIELSAIIIFKMWQCALTKPHFFDFNPLPFLLHAMLCYAKQGGVKCMFFSCGCCCAAGCCCWTLVRAACAAHNVGAGRESGQWPAPPAPVAGPGLAVTNWLSQR